MKRIENIFCDDLFLRNRAAAYSKNKKVLTFVLMGSLICYIVLFAASFVSTSYTPVRTTYMIFIAIFSFLIVLTFFLKDSTANILTYILHFTFVGYCSYNSAFIWTDDICVMILAELFIFSTLVLDKSLRIIVVSILSGVFYLVTISFSKVPYHFVDEVVNVICFTLLSSIVGIFTRKTQLQNFDNIQQLRLSQEHYELALKHSSGVVCEYNVDEKCIIMTKEAADVFNRPQRVYGVPYESVQNGIISSESSRDYIDFYEGILKGNKTGSTEFEIKTVNGWRWQKANYSTIFDDNGKPVSAVISLTDITDQKENERQQKERAETDGLTGVYNRATAETLINNMLLTKNGLPFGLLIIDMDNLKAINDTFGHPQGDKAIILLAKTLKKFIRNEDVFGRIGGDEFIAFLQEIETKQQIENKMSEFMQLMSTVCVGDKSDYHLSASVGIVLGTVGNHTFDELYSMADKALYQAKRNGKNQFAFYSDK